MILRPYQVEAVASVIKHHRSGDRSVCLVAPTGSGKTVMGARVVDMVVSRGKQVVWFCHRRELLNQAVSAINQLSGPGTAGKLGMGCPVTVTTVQSMLKREPVNDVRLVVFDEAHHYPADEWSVVAEAYDTAYRLGLTATPQRADGRGLSGMFDVLVASTSYSRLTADGHLVPCEVLRPDGPCEDGLAQTPVQAYMDNTPDERAFVFARDKKTAKEYQGQFIDAGIAARVIFGTTAKDRRDETLQLFADGIVKVLVNVHVLTEGVDVPAASTIILARGCSHASTYLQMVGRVLRPYPGKKHATLIDLPGVSHRHGLPGEDVEYSLGEGITTKGKKPDPDAVKGEAPDKPPPTIYSLALRRVYAGTETPTDAKDQEWLRLKSVSRQRGWSIAWAVAQYRKLFDHHPPEILKWPAAERQREYMALLMLARSRKYKNSAGWAGYRYKETFGKWPSRVWQRQSG